MIEHVNVSGLIGHGSFGYVFACEDNKGAKFAWKRMLKVGKTVSREMEVLEETKNCAHVAKLAYFFYSLNYRNELVQNFIFDYYSTNLEEILKMHQRNALSLNYFDIKKIIFQIVLGVAELHSKGICHRDLKPENILVRGSRLYIADLGSAKKLVEYNTPYVVSRYYRAPELILGITKYNLSIDLWAIAVIFYEFLFKKLPFKGRSEGQQLIEIFRALGPPRACEQNFMKSHIPSSSTEVEYLFQIKATHDLWSDFLDLEISIQEKQMLSNWFRECWNYQFDKRPLLQEAMLRPFWRDVREDAESVKLFQ